jgi:hypothetical protein
MQGLLKPVGFSISAFGKRIDKTHSEQVLLDDGLCVAGFMQKHLLLDAIQPSTGVGGIKKGA